MSLNLEQAYAQQERYQARPEVRDPLGGTALIAFNGTTASGKNFLMQASGLHVVGTETSRDKRESDDPQKYRYSTVDEMLTAIEEQEIIQYGVAAPEIYGSRLQDYELDKPNVSDIWSDAVHSLNNKGFSVVRSISVLTRRREYKARLEMRLEGMRLTDAFSRLDNDRGSLKWTRTHLATHDPNHLVIINDSDTLDDEGEEIQRVQENAEKIHDFAYGKPVKHPDEDLVHMILTENENLLTAKYGGPRLHEVPLGL